LKINLAIVGSMALSRGSRNPPRCTMSRFLPERDTCLSVTLQSADFCFCNLHQLQSHNFKLLFKTFNTHSLIQFTSSFLQLFTSFTQSPFGRLEHVKGVVIPHHTLHRLYRRTRLGDILPGICWFETADLHPRLVSNLRLGSRGVYESHPVRRYVTQTIFGILLIGLIHELFLSLTFFNETT